MMIRLLALVVAVPVLLTACQNKSPATRPSDRTESFSGTLQGGVMAIGGETTGWRLVGDGESGGMDVDVSQVADRARQLEGRRVTVTGKVAERKYVERGKVRVLVAERIEPSPQ